MRKTCISYKKNSYTKKIVFLPPGFLLTKYVFPLVEIQISLNEIFIFISADHISVSVD